MKSLPTVDANQAVKVLNEMLKADPEAVHLLVHHRVPCNKAMGDHPTVQVGLRKGADKEDLDNGYQVGILGLLNGVFGVNEDGQGYIVANCIGEAITGFSAR